MAENSLISYDTQTKLNILNYYLIIYKYSADRRKNTEKDPHVIEKEIDQVYDKYCDLTVEREYLKKVLKYFDGVRSDTLKTVKGYLDTVSDDVQDIKTNGDTLRKILTLIPSTTLTFEEAKVEEMKNHEANLLQAMRVITNELKTYEHKIIHSSGKIERKEYLDLEEMLNRLTKRVDELDARGALNLRSVKRNIITKIDHLHEELEKLG